MRTFFFAWDGVRYCVQDALEIVAILRYINNRADKNPS